MLNQLRAFRIPVFILAGLFLLFTYNNCAISVPGDTSYQDLSSGSKSPVVSTSSASSAPTPKPSATPNPIIQGADVCETDLMNLYSRGYHAFLKTNCKNCHSTGPGKGQFAHSDIYIAFPSFQQIGYLPVSNNAVNESHNPPYTGTKHIAAVNELKVEWQKGLQDYASCKGTTITAPPTNIADLVAYQTSQKASGISTVGGTATLVWDLNSNLTKLKTDAPALNAPGGKFQIKVTTGRSAGGEDFYLFSEPRVWGSSKDLHLKGIYIKINGQILRYQTTFRYVDTGIRASTANSAASLISIGSLVAPGVTSAQDQIAVAFEVIEETTLPPPPAPVEVKFEGEAVRWTSKGQPYMDVNVILSKATSDSLIVNVEVPSDAATCFKDVKVDNINTQLKTVGAADCFPEVKQFLCPSGQNCAADLILLGRARSTTGSSYNRYDWDYRFSALTLVFAPQQTSKSIRIFLSKDIRKENNRLLTLKLAAVLGAGTIGSPSSVQLIFDKLSNPTPSATVATFSELMNPQSGILGQNCLKCHNSTQKAGGYDMSNYEEMVTNGVLVPGEPSQSKMYKRLNPNDPQSTFLQPMPLDGFMEQANVREVEKWILNGAKND